MKRICLPILILCLMLGACSKQPEPVVPEQPVTKKMAPMTKATPAKEHTIRTMITGLDQYARENIMVLNTADDSFVIGPNVSAAQKAEIHSHLTEAYDRVIIIKYINKKGTGGTIAHKRVTALEIEGTCYLLPH